ncbi:MAG: phosphoribosylanthranilate isomerase [SAR202 cluster bacterium]|nr:phosphoribosylanthranilate isomerase [SAR202 cluster bacterium]
MTWQEKWLKYKSVDEMTKSYTQIKICGLRSAKAASVASECGADFLGFVFVDGVRRQLQPDEAAQIINEYRGSTQVSKSIKLVGLFRNQSVDFVNQTAAKTNLDFVQLCGEENSDYVSRLNLPIFRQIRVKDGTKPNDLYKTVESHLNAGHRVVLDRFDIDTPGGSGRSFNWSAAEGVAEQNHVLLAGGLKSENVQAAISQLAPWGVDVSSGVETDGIKDPKLIKTFIETVRAI